MSEIPVAFEFGGKGEPRAPEDAAALEQAFRLIEAWGGGYVGYMGVISQVLTELVEETNGDGEALWRALARLVETCASTSGMAVLSLAQKHGLEFADAFEPIREAVQRGRLLLPKETQPWPN